MKRHPEISHRTAESVQKARENVSEEGIRKWFKELYDYLSELKKRKQLKKSLIRRKKRPGERGKK